MIAKILTVQGAYYKTLKGKYDDAGSFTYNDDPPIPIPIISRLLKGKEHTIQCDITRVVDLDPKERFVIYKFDGRNYMQQGLEGEITNSDVSLYIAKVNEGFIIRDQQLEKPPDKNLALYMGFLILAAFGVVGFFALQGATNAVSNAAAPLNATVHQNAILIAQNHNETVYLNKLLAHVFNSTYTVRVGG